MLVSPETFGIPRGLPLWYKCSYYYILLFRGFALKPSLLRSQLPEEWMIAFIMFIILLCWKLTSWVNSTHWTSVQYSHCLVSLFKQLNFVIFLHFLDLLNQFYTNFHVTGTICYLVVTIQAVETLVTVWRTVQRAAMEPHVLQTLNASVTMHATPEPAVTKVPVMQFYRV